MVRALKSRSKDPNSRPGWVNMLCSLAKRMLCSKQSIQVNRYQGVAKEVW